MRSRITAIVTGVALIALGVVFSGNSLGLWNADVFFDGWWTLVLIIPALVSIIGTGPNVGNILLLLLGGTLLADAQRWFGDVSAWQLFFPAVMVGIGIFVVWRATREPVVVKDADGNPVHPSEVITAVFSGAQISFAGVPFRGATITAIFGGADIDLRGALIEHDVLIDATSIFGGTDIVVSPGTNVKLTSVGIFGGADSKAAPFDPAAGGPVVHVRSTAIFGGLDVKVK